MAEFRPLLSGSIAAYLARFDFDAPRRRLALCYFWPRGRRWIIAYARGSSGWTELHVIGNLLFGDSPWKRACVLRVFGRLGSVEATVAKLVEPSVDFGYVFEFEPDPGKVRGAFRAKYVEHGWDRVEEDYFRGLSAS